VLHVLLERLLEVGDGALEVALWSIL
jgi:hypothetical protein